MSNLMKIRPVRAEFFHATERHYESIDAFRNFTKASKMGGGNCRQESQVRQVS